MRTIVYTSILMLIASCLSYGQGEYLHLHPNCNGLRSSFTKVNVIDNRLGTQTLGFVQVGAFNKNVPVKFQGNIGDSLAQFFKCTDTTAKTQQELTMILYQLYLSEKTEAMSETGSVRIAMRLFSNIDQEKFKELYAIDSIYTFNAMDVTKRLLRSVSEHLCEIAKSAIEAKSVEFKTAPLYSLTELHQLDSLEKLKIPIYNAESINPGIYTDYEHFKSNTPDSSVISIDTDDAKNIKVYKWDKEKKKKRKIDCKSVYAVSDGSTLLKATSIGFYKMKKINFDFYYVGQTSFTNTNSNNVAMWGLAFGMVGAAIASGYEQNAPLFRFKINYLIGNSIPISIAPE